MSMPSFPSGSLEPPHPSDPPPPTTSRARRRARVYLWLISGTLVLIPVCLMVALPVRFPSAVRSTAAVTASQKWILISGSAGQLIARTVNYRTGMNDGYRVSNFNAGSSVSFSIDPRLAPGTHVAVGDTVGWVSSTETQERLVVLRGQLAAAQRSLDVNATGQKAAIIDEAEQRYLSAQRRRQEFQATLDRTKSLLEQHLIPEKD